MAGRRVHCYYLNQQSNGATLVHFQDFTVLGPHQDVAVAKRYGTYGGVVLQKQPCGVTLSDHEGVFCVSDEKRQILHAGSLPSGEPRPLPLEPGAKTDLLMA